MPRIYLDNSATTPVDIEVLNEMLPYYQDSFGNASSLHSFGRQAKDALERSRSKVAELINADKDEIIFTAGGTESDNIAIMGTAFRLKKNGNHIITTKIEHPAVLNTCKFLESHNFKVTYLPVDKEGFISSKDLENAITDKTILITTIHGNNEIGTIQDLDEITKISKEHGINFHTDAVQTVGKVKIDVKKLNIDLLSLSSHKMYGPKGIGALYVKKGTEITPINFGGGQEGGLRSSTENIPGIVGLGKACELAKKRYDYDIPYITKLRNMVIDGVLDKIDNSYLNGPRKNRLPHNANFSFDFIEGESLLLYLDSKGIAASTGSACSSASLKASHVLTAIGLKPEQAHGSLRLAIGRENNEEEIEYVLETLPEIVKILRKMSPLGRN